MPISVSNNSDLIEKIKPIPNSILIALTFALLI